jgi:hypothetical protein
MRPGFAKGSPSTRRVQGMPDAFCTRRLVCKMRKEAHTRVTGTDGAIRHSLRNGFTAYALLSPATNSSCHRRLQIKIWPNPVGLGKPLQAWHQQRVSGPHGFAVRAIRRSSCTPRDRSRAWLALRPRSRRRSRVHRIPSRVRDDARSAPLVGTRQRGKSHRFE